MENLSISQQIKVARQQKKLSQAELADKCNLNIRTIQRIENNEVNPRLYTLRIISKALCVELLTTNDFENGVEQISKYQKIFEKRKKIRLFSLVGSLFVLFVALLLLFSGIPKYIWAPFIYLLMFAYIIVIAITWRCPGCGGLLGDAFNTRYCSKCGLKFYDNK